VTRERISSFIAPVAVFAMWVGAAVLMFWGSP
jgi:hypothetical protein